jgi:hypothetical protein
MKELVVARYNENIRWLYEINDNFKLRIYNKGQDNIPFEYTKLPNIGGDAHTFIYHISENYDHLADFTAFVQGNPFDHETKTIEKINNHTDEQFMYLAEHICKESIHGWYEHLLLQRPPEKPISYLYPTGISILGKDCPQMVIFGAGQQFIVSKEIIQRRSQRFYSDIEKRFTDDFILPWHIERIWLNIFGITL